MWAKRAVFLHGLCFKFLIEFLSWHKPLLPLSCFLVSVCHSNKMELEHHHFPTNAPKNPFENHAISKSSGVHGERRLNPKAPNSASWELECTLHFTLTHAPSTPHCLALFIWFIRGLLLAPCWQACLVPCVPCPFFAWLTTLLCLLQIKGHFLGKSFPPHQEENIT